jgi:hypothetical protein
LRSLIRIHQTKNIMFHNEFSLLINGLKTASRNPWHQGVGAGR